LEATVFVARPPVPPAPRARPAPPVQPAPRCGPRLIRSARSTFTGSAAFLTDPANRAQAGTYLADLGRPYGLEVPAEPAAGHSYGEMAEALIGPVTRADEPVDLLVLAFSVHDLRPGRPAAAYLSHVTPGAPMAFAVCDQGAAAAFTGLRIVRDYMASSAVRRALLIAVEQAALPYSVAEPLPARHQGVALLLDNGLPGRPAAPGPDGPAGPGTPAGPGAPAGPHPSLAGLRQHPATPPGDVARLAAGDLSALAAGRRDVHLIVGAALAPLWTAPAASRVRTMPSGQPSTAIWWGLTEQLDGPGPAELTVAADYDPALGYLSLAAFAQSSIT
jgi:4-hydroxymandelate oxidase